MSLTDDQINNNIRCRCCERHNTNKPFTLEDFLNHQSNDDTQVEDNYDNNDTEHDEDNDDNDNHNNDIHNNVNECVACVTNDECNNNNNDAEHDEYNYDNNICQILSSYFNHNNIIDNECNCRCRHELREHFRRQQTLLNMNTCRVQ